MRFTAHYLVVPNDRLLKLAADDEDLQLLCEPTIVTSQEGGCRNMTTAGEYALRVKIYVLLHFASEYLATVKSIERFFGERQIDQKLFDSWWTLLRAEGVEPMPTFGEKFKVANILRSRVSETGSAAVEAWLERVAEFPPSGSSADLSTD